MRQKASKFAPYGDIVGKSRVAEIYFPTNSARLDRKDKRVLSLVAQYFKGELWLGRPAWVYLVAETDHRGNPEHNQRLSDKRLTAVSDHLAWLFKDEPRIGEFWAISGGEELRRFYTYNPKDKSDQATLRRVKILPTTNSFLKAEGGGSKWRKYVVKNGRVKRTHVLRSWIVREDEEKMYSR